MTLDLPSAAHQAGENPAEFLAGHREPLLLDEVQYSPGLFRHLKIAIDADRHQMGRFLMTGSQKFTLTRALSESLAGRCAVLELDTLSSAELRRTLGRRSLPPDAFLWRGGFPELYRDPELGARGFYASYVATYLANQALLLEPYLGNVGKRLIKTPKLFLRDTGLLCFFLGLDSAPALLRSPFIGTVWETFVLNQILRARATAGSGAALFFWRDTHGTEVDFVVEHGGRLRLIEARWAENVSDAKHLAALVKVRHLLGKRAADVHWVACRTPHAHTIPGLQDVRAINGYTFEDWLSS